MEASELARALVKRRWDAVEARQRVRGKWTGDINPMRSLQPNKEEQ
jgi:hypothetical protein